MYTYVFVYHKIPKIVVIVNFPLITSLRELPSVTKPIQRNSG